MKQKTTVNGFVFDNRFTMSSLILFLVHIQSCFNSLSSFSLDTSDSEKVQSYCGVELNLYFIWLSENTGSGVMSTDRCLIPFWEWPHVKTPSDTDHWTTNCLSQPLYNSSAESTPASSTPKSHHFCGGEHVYGNHGWEGWGPTWSWNRSKSTRSMCSSLSLKTTKPQTINTYKQSSFWRTRQTSSHTRWRQFWLKISRLNMKL